MKRKTMLLAAAALSVVAFTALPSMASAFNTTPVISLPKYPTAISGTSGAGTLYTASGRKVTCESSETAGNVETGHTGSIKVTFKGCKESTLGSKCTTPGQATSGTIVTETLKFHTVYLTPTNFEKPHETPGIVITPNETSGKFAEFTCAGGLVKIVVTGSGVLGTVTEPTLEGEGSSTMTVNVSATELGQEHNEITDEEEGGKLVMVPYGLKSSTNGGAAEAAYENAGSSKLSLAEGIGKTTTKTP